jgi:hypothetical protein
LSNIFDKAACLRVEWGAPPAVTRRLIIRIKIQDAAFDSDTANFASKDLLPRYEFDVSDKGNGEIVNDINEYI